MARILIVVLAVVFLSCAGGAARKGSSLRSIDSLITTQVRYLANGRYQLEKNAAVDEESSSVTFRPDSAGWAQELSVFRELEVASRPTYRDRYVITDTEDSNSNLHIRSFDATETPVPFIRFYYLNGPDDIRKIEAAYFESNSLYSSRRELVLEFDEVAGVRILHSYQIDGFQKISLADSVHFLVKGEVIF